MLIRGQKCTPESNVLPKKRTFLLSAKLAVNDTGRLCIEPAWNRQVCVVLWLPEQVLNKFTFHVWSTTGADDTHQRPVKWRILTSGDQHHLLRDDDEVLQIDVYGHMRATF